MTIEISNAIALLELYVRQAGYAVLDKDTQRLVAMPNGQPKSAHSGGDIYAHRLIDALLEALKSQSANNLAINEKWIQLKSFIPAPAESLNTPTAQQLNDAFKSRNGNAKRRMDLSAADAHTTTMHRWAQQLGIDVVDNGSGSESVDATTSSDSDSESDTVLDVAQKIFKHCAADTQSTLAMQHTITVEKATHDAICDHTLNLADTLVQSFVGKKLSPDAPMRLYTAFAIQNVLGKTEYCAQAAKAVSQNENGVQAEQHQNRSAVRKANNNFARRMQKNIDFTDTFLEKYNRIQSRDCLRGAKHYNLIGNQDTNSINVQYLLKHAAGLHTGSKGTRTKNLLLSFAKSAEDKKQVRNLLTTITRSGSVNKEQINQIVDLLSPSTSQSAHKHASLFSRAVQWQRQDAMIASLPTPFNPYR